MQASFTWTPPGGTLGRILEETRRRLASLDRAEPTGAGAGDGAVRPGDAFGTALRGKTVAVIAELKRKSPSKGVLNGKLDAGDQARAFESGGAAAISVLTEPSFFDGSIGDLTNVRKAVRIPVLKKDFHIDVAQLHEAAGAKADAVLLIARALPQDQLVALLATAQKLGLAALVEVRSQPELDRSLEAGARIVGVNSRDLETLQVDERVPARLVPKIPAEVIAIWESGVATPDDVQRAADAGADAVLVGSALSRASDPAALVRSLSSTARRGR